MIGDTVWDVESANKCDFPCVGVLTGGALADVESPAAITTDLDDLLKRARP